MRGDPAYFQNLPSRIADRQRKRMRRQDRFVSSSESVNLPRLYPGAGVGLWLDRCHAARHWWKSGKTLVVSVDLSCNGCWIQLESLGRS